MTGTKNVQISEENGLVNFIQFLLMKLAATTLSNYLFIFDLWTVKAAFLKNS